MSTTPVTKTRKRRRGNAGIRGVASAHCDDPRHHNAVVAGWGTYTRKSGTYRSYECRPLSGDPHRFSVRLDGGSSLRGLPGAPACSEHPIATITRWGTYGPDGRERQRYRCVHPRCDDRCEIGCTGHHTFAPVVPRAHVCAGRRCATCRQPRGVHSGDMASARRSQFPALVSSRALADISLRVSYAKAGREALEAMDLDLTIRRRAPSANPPKPRRRWSKRKKRARSAATRMWGRFWHVAAGILEAYGPVVWAAAEERLRERAAGIVALGERRVWILDEIPIYALAANGKRKKSDGWVVLVLAEMDWTDKETPGRTKLRLVRAMPKANSTAWRLAFSEVSRRDQPGRGRGLEPRRSSPGARRMPRPSR